MLNSPRDEGYSTYPASGAGYTGGIAPVAGGGTVVSEISEHSLDTSKVGPLSLQAYSNETRLPSSQPQAVGAARFPQRRFHEDCSAEPAGPPIEADGLNSFAVTAVPNLAKQHFEWAQELEDVDQRQAGLMNLQWKLVRNQTGMLAQQLVEVKGQIEDLQRGQETIVPRFDVIATDHQNFENRLQAFVTNIREKLEQSISRVKQDLDKEARQRDVGDIEVYKKLQQLSEEVGGNLARSARLQPLEQEVRDLRADLTTHAQQIPALRDHVHESADELKSRVDGLVEHIRRVKEGLDTEMHDRSAAHEELYAMVHVALEKERSDRDSNLAKLRGYFEIMQTDIAGHREELPVFRTRLQELEDKLHKNHAEITKMIESRFTEPTSKLQQFERRLVDMLASINQESVARHHMAEVFEQQLKTEHTKLTNLITQKAAFARLDCEEMQKSLIEKLDKERVEREEALEGLHSLLSRHKAAVTDRVGAMEGECRSVMERHQALVAEVRESEIRCRKLEDYVQNAVREVTVQIQASVDKERAARESVDAQLEEQLAWYGDQYDRVRELFIQRGPRAMRMAVASASTHGSRANSPPSR